MLKLKRLVVAFAICYVKKILPSASLISRNHKRAIMTKDKHEKSDQSHKSQKCNESGRIKKSKKGKNSKLNKENIAAAFEEATKEVKTLVTDEKEIIKIKKDSIPLRPIGNLVPFANPLADEKVTVKVLKGVKKASKAKTLKRGVKEVVKALRKSPQGLGITSIPGVVVLAADISPMDVISHIPVLCEDHKVPYIFVRSRAELGSAGNTKRPTSVVMISETRVGSKKADKIESSEEFKDTYKQLVAIIEKEARNVRV